MTTVYPLSVQTNMTREVSPQPGLLGPIPNGVRRVSGGDTSPSLRPVSFGSPLPSSNQGNTSTDSDQTSSPWSTAVGYAATSGKSGRVIERLMAENDRLKRELELQLLKVQDLEKSAQTYKPQIDALLEKVDSLTHASSMDANLLSRRDRRIEELRTDNAQLKEGKDNLQRRVRDVERERDDTREQTQRDIQTMSESTKHATIHAEILETSHRQLAAEYRARRVAWEHDLNALVDRQEQETQRMMRLDVVCEQMRQENERTKKLMADMLVKWEQYERSISTTLEASDRATQQTDLKSKEMEEVVDRMRWLMGLKTNTNLDTGRAKGTPKTKK